MKVAISNMAWRSDEDEKVAEVLPTMGITGIEISPSRVWENPLAVTALQVSRQRQFWENRGMPVVTIHSLLSTHPEW